MLKLFFLDKKWCYMLLFICFYQYDALAISPEIYLPKHQEERARELFWQVKCPVCAGQVIESSDTQIAYQLRKLIRDQIREGKSDDEIKSYLVEKYGDDILNNPIVNTKNIALWLLPILFFIVGAFVIKINFLSRKG